MREPIKQFAPTGRWETNSVYSSNHERGVPVLVSPDGVVSGVWEPTDFGWGEAEAYACMYNLNQFGEEYPPTATPAPSSENDILDKGTGAPPSA